MSWSELHATLTARASTETVARLILDAGGPGLSPAAREHLARVAASRPPWYVSSMSEDFERPADCAAQLRSALRVCGAFLPASAVHAVAADPGGLAEVIDRLGAPIGWAHGQDWKRDRLNRGGRAALARGGPAVPKRQYNRRVRALRHLEAERTQMARQQLMRRLILAGRSGFAYEIGEREFAAHPAAARFAVYWTARRNRRRMFTLEGKENPMDGAAAALLAQCMRDGLPEPGWAMVAKVYPKAEALAHLGDRARGELAARWFALMREAAGMLATSWPGEANKLSMIVRRGMDSSTWNTMAQAYNSARDGWVNCTFAAGLEALLGPVLPGKAMRLMAADLAYWHRARGGDVDPDTKVWAMLPMPWEVIGGRAACTRADVEAACIEQGVTDPAGRGWTAPRAMGHLAAHEPTPELVHGVAVGDPQWAAVLRRAGVFSGRLADESRAAEAASLRAAAQAAGMVTGPLPVYAGGQYLGHT